MDSRRWFLSERRIFLNNMKELMQVYVESFNKLKQRHEELMQEKVFYDKRVVLLEEEMDELQEVMCMMRPYLEQP